MLYKTQKTFNSKCCFYVKGNYLLSNYLQYLSTFVEELKANQKSLLARSADDIIMFRTFFEIEGTLKAENVATTHKRVKDIYQKTTLTDKNDIIVKNMIAAMQFIVKEKPSFDKENLLKFYNILSFNCLDDEDKLKEGAYYRDEGVLITYKDFFEYIHSTMTKQGGLKVLNSFVEYNLLVKDINKKKEAIYRVNPEILTYKFQE